jgi:hypothetical protein
LELKVHRVPGVLALDECAALIARAEQTVPTAVDQPGGPAIFGPLLAPTQNAPGGPDPAEYLASAAVWNRHSSAIWDICTVHKALERHLGASVRVPPGHARFTIRRFPPGTASPWHTDNYRAIAAYATVAGLTAGPQLSWLVPLAPYEGGALEIPASGGPLYPAPGELVIFDGSALRHRVAGVGGARPRWTLGGFAARGPSGWYAWS